MASETSGKPVKAGLSLYANLLDPSITDTTTPGTISRAPVVFNRSQGDDLQQEEALASKQQISAASLRFQPTKRPQLTTQKPKIKPIIQKGINLSNLNPKDQETDNLEVPSTTARLGGKSTLADWAAEGEDDEMSGLYLSEKRQRGGRKKRKKTKEDSFALQNWDDIYDPSRPNSYEEYKHSDEKISEMREWKDRLYAHRQVRSQSSNFSEFGEPNRSFTQQSKPLKTSFIQASNINDIPTTIDPIEPSQKPDDPSAKGVYSQHTRLSEAQNNEEGRSKDFSFDPSNVSLDSNTLHSPLDSFKTSQSSSLTPHNQPNTAPLAPTISRAPVRYNLSFPPSELPTSEAEFERIINDEEVEDEAPRSLRPGQQGFAERLMSKYGWTKGTGLGASGTGIVNPLRVQVEKQKRKPDSEGGGFVGPGGKGKIVGDTKKGGSSAENETGKFGIMSEVVILRGMVDGMDLDVELEGAGDGGLIQEIGEECGEKYGRVERVYIDRSVAHKPLVFVKFTSQLSALRAVNALEQRIFSGNTITARFYDLDKFETGVYS